MSATSQVVQMKEDLLKELPIESDEAIDRCRDILGRLDEVPMSIAILSDTMIGKAVAQLKAHESLGSTAKSLIKKWKQIAKAGDVSASGATTTTPVKTKVERRTSDASSSAGGNTSSAGPDEFQAELQGLSPMRQIICKKFMDIFLNTKDTLVELGINEEAIVHLLGPRAIEVEAAIWSTCPEKKAYTEKGRSLVFNLKRNKSLTQDVILGNVTPETLAKMTSEELLSEEKRQERSQEAKKIIDSKRLDWDKANESKINEMCGIKGDLLKASLFTCGRCKSTKTTSTQKQTRSADEPMTVFVLCLNCGKRWKC
jgi:transcription elongation factor S-II